LGEGDLVFQLVEAAGDCANEDSQDAGNDLIHGGSPRQKAIDGTRNNIDMQENTEYSRIMHTRRRYRRFPMALRLYRPYEIKLFNGVMDEQMSDRIS
jgi:hypothetical protein